MIKNVDVNNISSVDKDDIKIQKRSITSQDH